MTYRIGKCAPDGLLLLPEETLAHTDRTGEEELRILLHLASLLRGGAMEEEEILDALGDRFAAEALRGALGFWRGCGILDTGGEGKKPSRAKREEPEKKTIDADEAPFYTAKDLADAAQAHPEFKNLVAFAERRLEKVMNASELARLYSFLDYLKMPADVVMLVIEDSAARDKKSLRYITKVLTSFQDEGIDTYEKAEAWVAARQENAVYENFVRTLFGLGTRKLTAAEEEIIRTWRTLYGYGEDVLNAAYEKTVASAKNPSIKYMHKILESWYRDGVKTAEDIGKVAEKAPGKAEKSYDLDDFFQKALSKGRKEL